MRRTPEELALDNVLDEVFAVGLTITELATAAGLGYVTVWRLWHRETRQPRFSTIWKLAKAVGMDLVMVKQIMQRRRRAG